jgi:hypothetical protein
MFSLGSFILLMSMRTRKKVRYTNLIKERIELFIFITPICLHCNNFPIKESLDKGLKLMEFLKHLGFELNKIDPRKFTKVINETHILIVSASRLKS